MQMKSTLFTAALFGFAAAQDIALINDDSAWEASYKEHRAAFVVPDGDHVDIASDALNALVLLALGLRTDGKEVGVSTYLDKALDGWFSES